MAVGTAGKPKPSGSGVRVYNSLRQDGSASATKGANRKVDAGAERLSRPNQAVPKPIRLNVGCGSSPTEGWANLDNSFSVRFANRPRLLKLLVRAHLTSSESIELGRLARLRDVRWASCGRLPYEEGSVDVIYSSHMFEHLDRSEAREFLKESLRVLAPGGTIRLAVPDLSRLVAEYLITGDADRLVDRTYLALSKPKSIRAKILASVVGTRHHHWMYDGQSLCAALTAAGFVDAAAQIAGSTTIERSELLDLFERESESIYVEAKKQPNS
jgi:predicted SAM-dependent methyltransferase